MALHPHTAFCYIASWRFARLLLEKHIKYTAVDAVVFASDSPCYFKGASWTLLTFFLGICGSFGRDELLPVAVHQSGLHMRWRFAPLLGVTAIRDVSLQERL